MRLFNSAVVAVLVLGAWTAVDSGVALLAPATPAPNPAAVTEFDSDGDGWMTDLEFEAAMEASVAMHTWPEAYPVTLERIVDNPWHGADLGGGQVGYSVGMEHMLVGLFNTCAWYIDWLEAQEMGDAEREATALDAIVAILPMNPDGEYLKQPDARVEYAREAEGGDPTNLQQWVDGNCQMVPFLTPEPGNGQ